MSKTRTKRKSEKRISTAKAQDKWAKQKTWLNWLPVILSAAFLFALPYLTGTNNLFWTSILLSSVLAMGLLATIWLLWKRQSLTLTVAEIFLLAFVFWQWLTVVNSVYRWASMLEASRWTAFAVLVFAVKQLTGRETRDEGQDAKQQLSHSAPRTSHPTWFAVSFVAAATVTAIHGIAEYALNAASGIPHWRIFRSFFAAQLVWQFPAPRFLCCLRFSRSTTSTPHLALRIHRTFVLDCNGFNRFKRRAVGVVRRHCRFWHSFGDKLCFTKVAKVGLGCFIFRGCSTNLDRLAPSADSLEV
jgi:hypothetical protein